MGAISTAIEVAVFNLLYLVLGWDVVAAKIVASLVALVNAYIGNRQWTFRGRPLYRWRGDAAPGDATGDGFLEGAWRIARP